MARSNKLQEVTDAHVTNFASNKCLPNVTALFAVPSTSADCEDYLHFKR